MGPHTILTPASVASVAQASSQSANWNLELDNSVALMPFDANMFFIRCVPVAGALTMGSHFWGPTIQLHH